MSKCNKYHDNDGCMKPCFPIERVFFMGATGPTGATGATGPSGISNLRSAYLVTFNDGVGYQGKIIEQNAPIPIERSEIDVSNLVKLNLDDNTIQFNEPGYYKITFSITAYLLSDTGVFDPKSDIVAVGFRQVGTDNIYVGASNWIHEEKPINLIGQGIISVDNTNNVYELANVSNKEIYLSSPNIEDIKSKSYFTNQLVTMNIDYLGRMGV